MDDPFGLGYHPGMRPLPSSLREAPRLASALWVLGVVVTLAMVGAYLRSPLAGGDFGWHVANGRMILHLGRIVHRQLLAQADRGQPWGDDAWLWDVGAAAIYGALGMRGIALLQGFLAASTALFTAQLVRDLPAGLTLALAAGVGWALMLAMPARPEVLSYPLFALTLWGLERWRAGDLRPLAASSALFGVWVNAHASWPLWFGLVGVEAVWAPPGRRGALWAALGLGAVWLWFAPTGLRSLATLGHVASPGNLSVIAEWQSPNFHEPLFWPAALLVAGVPAVVAGPLWRARDWPRVLWLAGTVGSALFAVRLIPYAGLGAAALVAGVRRAAPADPGPSWRWGGVTGAVAGLVAAAVVALGHYPPDPLVGALRYLKVHRAGPILNAYRLGGPLELAGLTPFLDGRNDLWLQDPWWPAYLAMTSGNLPVGRFLARDDPGARWAIWYSGTPPAWQMAGLGWREVYRGQGIEIWHRP